MRRFGTLVCCAALALVPTGMAARAGVMDPIPGDPITIETGKLSGMLVFGDNGLTVETFNEKQVDVIESRLQRRNNAGASYDNPP